MAYSDKVAEDIEKEQTNTIQLMTANKHLKEQINDIYAFHQEVAWDKITEALEMRNPDNYFDECVNQYLSEYNTKIVEYIEDLRNKRSRVDIENGLEGVLMDAAMEDDHIIDPTNYLDRYKNSIAIGGENIPDKKNLIGYDESPV